MSYKIKTAYADGRTEEREATAEEVAQREQDALQAEQVEREMKERLQAKQAARQAGITKLMELGLTEEQALAIAG